MSETGCDRLNRADDLFFDDTFFDYFGIGDITEITTIMWLHSRYKQAYENIKPGLNHDKPAIS